MPLSNKDFRSIQDNLQVVVQTETAKIAVLKYEEAWVMREDLPSISPFLYDLTYIEWIVAVVYGGCETYVFQATNAYRLCVVNLGTLISYQKGT